MISLLEESDAYSVKYDAGKKEIVLGEAYTRVAGEAVLISNLKGGTIAPGSTEAINGGQLNTLGESAHDIFGGSVTFEGGKLSGGITVDGNDYTSVQSALSGITNGAGTVVVTSGDLGWVLTVDGETKSMKAGAELAVKSGGNVSIAKNDSGAYVFDLKKDIAADSVTLNKEAEIRAGGKEAAGVGQLHTLGESAQDIFGGNVTFEGGKLSGGFTVNGKNGLTVQQALEEAAQTGGGAGPGAGSWTLSVNGEESKIGDGGQVSVNSGSNIEINKNDAGAYEIGVVKNPEFESVKVGKIDINKEGVDMGGGYVTNIADGAIGQGSRDAVNGGQLWEAYRRIETVDERVQVVGAHAAALSAMHPVAYNPYEPTTISAGVGFYRNEQSLAVGLFHYARENVLLNAGVSFNSDGDTMGRAGISFSLCKRGKKQPSMYQDMSEMRQVMLAMQEKLKKLEEKNEQNEETIKELKEELKNKK
ncbi:MAG: YadA-like family protein [Cloacibacillus porcorum]|uniref:YadA-like family protein n=1 Tax=Cloacibacillus porcorum TaxID=1197717 RepID=UPI0023F20D63|nr:YadA-like family protein [Cloacibacillus porcorum]MCD7875969.1 YadA-like family protein [Cloacibacillus porcorum]